MKNLGTIAAWMLAALAAGAPAYAPAQTPNVYQSFESGEHAHPHGDIRGEIESIDYGSSTMVVRSGHERYTITVTPSTQIYGGSHYSSLSDLKRGVSVEVTASDVNGTLVAQSIHVH